MLGVDNFDPFYDRARKEHNWREATRDHAPNAELLALDITDTGSLQAAFARGPISGVIHLAGKAGVRPSIADPAGYMHVNVTGTANVLDAARVAGCSRVVIASSSSVYGNAAVAPGMPFHEDLDVSRPISPYAASKRACELLVHAHWHLHRQPVSLLRFFTVYGPRQRPDLAIAGFMKAIAAGEPIRVFGDGSTSRDYTFIHDIVAGVLAAYDKTPEHGYRIWNLGNHKPVSLAQMVNAIERVVGKKAIIQHEPMQQGDVERTCADITRAQKELGYAPRTSFEEGLARQWAAAESAFGIRD